MWSVQVIVLLTSVVVLDCRSKSFADSHSFHISAENINWPSRSVRNIYSSSGRFTARNIIPTRVQICGLWAFVAFPRLRPGVPISLGRITLLPSHRKQTEVEAYPSWDMQEEGHKDAIQNAVDLYIDERRILWVLDTGWVDTFSCPSIKGRPRVFGINTRNGKVQYDVDLSRFASPQSKFQYVVAENSLNRPVLFIADAASCAVVVWDVVQEKGSLIPLPNPEEKTDSLYMVMLRPAKSEPILVFSHLSSPTLYGVCVSSLRQGQIGELKNLGTKTGEMIILGTDNGSKIYLRWKGDRQIRVWDLCKREAERGAPVGALDDFRTSTHVAGGGAALITWSLESNFADFVEGTVGSLGASAVLKPLMKDL